jgi:phenylacetate-CoA ligase
VTQPRTNPERLLGEMLEAWNGDPDAWRSRLLRRRDELVWYARDRCPHYRRVIPEGARFRDIPVLTRDDVIRHSSDLLAEGVPQERRVPKRTSGSHGSGEPLRFLRDALQGPLEDDAARPFLLWLHGIPADATMVWVGSNPVPSPPDLQARFPRVALARHMILLRMGRHPPDRHTVATASLTPRRVALELRAWRSLDPWWLYGHASAIGWMAGEAEARRLPLPRSPVAVVTTADTLTIDAAHRIGRVFGAPVHQWYGSNEFNGFLAGTLPGSRRYVVNPFIGHAEVLDARGDPSPAGQPGRLVITDLNNRVMPFIRYDTGDAAIGSEDSRGAFPVLEGIEGRSSELIPLPGGRMLSAVTLGHVLFMLNDFGPSIRSWQCVEVAERSLELRVVWASGSPPREEALSAVQRLVGPQVAVRIRDVDALERLPSGKAWIIRSLARS